MLPDQPSSADFSGSSSFFLNSTNKNQADHTLPPSSNSSVLRYRIPDHFPKRRRPPLFLISVTSPYRLRWDFLIMLLAVWNCFYVPFAMAFLSDRESSLLVPVNVLIDLAYICDLVVYARSTYIDLYTGEEVKDSKLILKHYYESGKLGIDVISGIPFGIITWITDKSEHFQLLALLKIARLLRLSKIIMFMRTKEQIKLKIKLLQIFFLFFTYLHVIACLWYLLLCENKQYIPPALYIDREADLYTSSAYRQYAYSLYMSVYMLTAAEIGPRTPWERIFAGFAVISGQLLQGFLFGQLTVTLLNIHKRSSKVGKLQMATNTTMVNLQLPKSLHHRVFSYLVSIQGSVTSREEIHSIIDILPPSFQQEIRESVFRAVIENYISLHTEMTEDLLQRLLHSCPKPEDAIVSQGGDSDCMYFIATGNYEVYVQDELGNSRKVRSLKRGAKFGEIGLLYQTKRTASVVSTGFGILAVLKRADFDLISWKFPQIWTDLQVSALGYQDKWKTFMIKTTLKCPFFASLSEETLCELIYLLPIQQLKAGEFLYREGDVVDKAVFILSGNAEVYLSVTDSKAAEFVHPIAASAQAKAAGPSLHLRRGSILVVPKQKAAKNRVFTKLVVEELGQGSALCCNLLLLKDKAQFSAKATESTSVFVLSKKLLSKLTQQKPEIAESVEKYKVKLTDLLENWPIRRFQITAGDFEKSFSPRTRKSVFKHWTARMKVKRCAFGKLVEKRNLRDEGISDLPNLTRRLGAILDAIGKKDLFLAEKLHRGFMPHTTADLGKVFGLLQAQEVENPLITQFASEAVKLNLRGLGEGLLRTVGQFEVLEKGRRKQMEELRELRKLMSLVRDINVYR